MNDSLFRRPEIHPIEKLLDQEAEKALQGDQQLAEYMLEKTKIKNEGEKFI